MRALLLLPLLLFGAVAGRAQDIHRCLGADGQLVFTDRACADLKATPAPDAPAAAPPSPATERIAERIAPARCAADAQALKQSVADAFATRDPNQLAGLMLWGGRGGRSTVADLRGLAALVRQPLLDVDAYDAAQEAGTSGTLSSAAAAGDAPPAITGLTVRTAVRDGSGGEAATRFAVVRRAGCLWLRPGG
ncbi:DUF4124 domain-containing protein [Frateuria defendens]|uniref:DUF4124 domain-containing protein n=1 Tax=Frateuria defendens TaxID=2219559 RepID=UPI00066FE5E1|nr:DUF4124 domain-containing protein [Frateuria defendens]